MQQRWEDQNNNQVQMPLQDISNIKAVSNVGHLLPIKIISKQNSL